MDFLQLIVVAVLAVTVCQGEDGGQPKVNPFRQKENTLLQLLLSEKTLNWNGNKVQGVRRVIDDVKNGKDINNEDPATKMELALAYRSLLQLNPFQEERIKEEFRQYLGQTIADQVFGVSEKIMEIELEAKKQLQDDFKMNYHEKNAFKKLEKDVDAGKDPLDENAKITRRISKDGAKLFSLSSEDQETELALLTTAYGAKKAQEIISAMKTMREEVLAKAKAADEAEKAMSADLGTGQR